MIKLNYKGRIKKIISIFLVLVMLMFTAAPMSMAAVTYPQNITKEQALSVIEKTDTVLTKVLMQLQNTTLKDIVLKEVCSSSVLSMIVMEIYKAVEANAESLSVLNLSTTPTDVSAYLENYPQVQERLRTALSRH